MALVRKKVKGKVYLYEVRYENGKHVWKYIGKVTNEVTNELKITHKKLVSLGRDLNPRPLLYQSSALPAELPRLS